jgi:coenzyme F420-reducing hydrogenase beta subunit
MAGTASPRSIVSAGLCIGCGSCAAAADDARMVWDRRGQLRPDGPAEWLRHGSRDFADICPFSPQARNEDELALGQFAHARSADARIGRFEAAYVGHVAEPAFRAAGSSGGMVSWAAVELMRRGLVDGVAHVVAADRRSDGRLFRYRISRSEKEIREGARSRYYPIDLSAVLREMRVIPGRYAVVGIPCFIKAVNLLRAEDPLMRERIAFTLGLFCGHMKSARMVESFAWQMEADPAAVEAIEYRVKDGTRPANWYRAELRLADGSTRQRDWWHLVDGDWGSGFFQHSACNFCDDVVAETADISFGDAWVEPYSSDGRGTNVVVVRTPLLNELLLSGIAERRLELRPVDADFVVETQAAGFRQRREGLAYRMAWLRRKIRPRKRVRPGAAKLPLRRRLIYRMRYEISAWSHRVFWLARALDMPGLYLAWGRAALTIYHALTYSRGGLGRALDRVGRLAGQWRGSA